MSAQATNGGQGSAPPLLPPDPQERARQRLVAALVHAYQAGCEMADLLSGSLCEAAAKVGGPEQLLHRRSGSWEAEAVETLLGPYDFLGAEERPDPDAPPPATVFCSLAPEGNVCSLCGGRRPPTALSPAVAPPPREPFAAGARRPSWSDPAIRAAALEKLLPAIVAWEHPDDDDGEMLTGEALEQVTGEMRADLLQVLSGERPSHDGYDIAGRLYEVGQHLWLPDERLVALLATYPGLASAERKEAVARWVKEAGVTLPFQVWDIVLLKGVLWSWDGVPGIVVGRQPEMAEYTVAPLYWPECRGSIDRTLTFWAEHVHVWSPDEPLLWHVVKALGARDFATLTELAMTAAPARQRRSFPVFAGQPSAAPGGVA